MPDDPDLRSAKPEPLPDRGWKLLDAGRAEEALAFGQALLGRRPSAAAYYLCGEALYRLRHIAEAERYLAAAIEAGAEPEALAQSRWMCAMLRGDFAAAWRISDAVLVARHGQSCDQLPRHLRWVWDGTPLRGRVLIRCYHGLGDTLQCARFAPVLEERGCRVAIEAQPALLPLLRSLPGNPVLLPLGGPLPPHDVALEALELPYALRLTADRIPQRVPYLAVPRERVEAARALVKIQKDRLAVGIVWAAGAWRPERSLPHSLLAPLAALPQMTLYSLQRGPALAELADAAAPRFAGAVMSDDVLETAALMTHLDIIVTVDTMVAHLAGALGLPVWTLLPFAADWRWMLDRAASPWYPTMRLFRQPAPGAWQPVIERVSAELARMPPHRA